MRRYSWFSSKDLPELKDILEEEGYDVRKDKLWESKKELTTKERLVTGSDNIRATYYPKSCLLTVTGDIVTEEDSRLLEITKKEYPHKFTLRPRRVF